ncbi:alpha/beta hydrolase [Nocardia suismassiliense]|uniref:alpha/beta hydrolase n=1 Tax=Nocardia suismassiliense TaxID=2077092 RepID=UPI000D1FDAB4|nr:alpha/beta hydrolase [Nocardia suismassiliense]
MTYSYDPELAESAARSLGGSWTDATAARQRIAEKFAGLPKHQPSVPLRVQDRTIAGPSGNDIPVRLFAPRDRTSDLAALVYFHGGGYVINGVIDGDNHASRVADEVGALVVSVDYRLAPEHPFPAAHDDCYTALEWVAKNTAELGVDPERIGVGGESAGGGLAAAVALRARDEHGPAIRFLYLIVPELDDRLQTHSARTYTDTPNWSRTIGQQSWSYYLGTGVPGSPDVSAYAAPARAHDLTNMPPTHISAMQFDPLRDEDIDFAQRLLQAGVNTELHCYPGTFHGSHLTDAAISRRTLADAMAALRRGLVD